jgi:BirA family transcriptional regulator, biotin operon repressor / biotin---[acetyl-CoA-carboxylase] ligase
LAEEPEMTPLIQLAEVDSTQAFLARHPELGCCGVLAGAQTQGRGRQGHRWESEAGTGLYLSVRIPKPMIAPGLVLQQAMAAVVAELESTGLCLGLKWPNDLVALRRGELVKVGGILGEAKGDALLLGLGINLRWTPELPDRAIPPASLLELGALEIPEPAALARALMNRWMDLECAPEPLFRWPLVGDPIQWEEGQGLCLGWEADGRLRVATGTGTLLLSAGDVRGLKT